MSNTNNITSLCDINSITEYSMMYNLDKRLLADWLSAINLQILFQHMYEGKIC